MKIQRSGKIKLETEFSYQENITVCLEENSSTSISGWRSANSKLSELEYLTKCRDELTKMIAKLETGELEELPKKKWFEFWRKK